MKTRIRWRGVSHDEDWKTIPAVDSPHRRFEKIVSQGSMDYALRTVMRGLVQFSSLADHKANILITICALVFSIGLTQLGRVEVRGPLLVLLTAAAVSLMLAILAVLPRFKRPAPPGQREPGRAIFNPFFFMHFSTIDTERYLDVMD